MRRWLYRRLHKILCALCGHPLWEVPRYRYLECGCGRVSRDC
jgi:hypothetical protein